MQAAIDRYELYYPEFLGEGDVSLNGRNYVSRIDYSFSCNARPVRALNNWRSHAPTSWPHRSGSHGAESGSRMCGFMRFRAIRNRRSNICAKRSMRPAVPLAVRTRAGSGTCRAARDAGIRGDRRDDPRTWNASGRAWLPTPSGGCGALTEAGLRHVEPRALSQNWVDGF